MTTTKMSVARAMNEVKLLEKRINKATDFQTSQHFIATKTESKGILGSLGQEKNPKDKIAGNLKSVEDLILLRNKIKSAIMLSNATEQVTIAKETMSRAEAIERKNSIRFKHDLLQVMKKQYYNATSEVDTHNAKIEKDAYNLINNNKSDSENNKDSEELYKAYVKHNKKEIYDPLNLLKEIEKLEHEIDSFESEIDFVLNESNVRTDIEF